MDIKIELLLDIIEFANEECIFIATDYMGFLDIDFFNKHIQDFNYKKYGQLTMPLNNNNKKSFINYLSKMDSLFFQEIHIVCNNEILLESYDNFDAGISISKSININIEKYKKAGIDIGYLKE